MRFLFFVTLSILNLTSFSQNRYSYNDSTLMMQLKLCYYGDSVIYNDLSDEFYGPLRKCSWGEYHTFYIDDYLIIVPNDAAYVGSGGGIIFLYKMKNDSYIRVDDIWGNFDFEKVDLNNEVFAYSKTYKSTNWYTMKYTFRINSVDEKFEIISKTKL